MRRSPISPVSAKRRAEAHEYDRARTIAFLRDKGVCQAARIWTDVECSGSRVDTHHIRPRGRGGAYADPENLVCVCRAHHDSIHAWPLKAKELGLLA